MRDEEGEVGDDDEEEGGDEGRDQGALHSPDQIKIKTKIKIANLIRCSSKRRLEYSAS